MLSALGFAVSLNDRPTYAYSYPPSHPLSSRPTYACPHPPTYFCLHYPTYPLSSRPTLTPHPTYSCNHLPTLSPSYLFTNTPPILPTLSCSHPSYLPFPHPT
eukprot:3361256-Rhodomonas_salina.1